MFDVILMYSIWVSQLLGGKYLWLIAVVLLILIESLMTIPINQM